MSVLLVKLFRSVPIMGCYLKCPDMAKLLLWEQYIVAVSGDVQQRFPRQFLDSGAQAHGQAQQGIQVQPVQYICSCKSTPRPIQSISHNVTRTSQDRKWLPEYISSVVDVPSFCCLPILFSSQFFIFLTFVVNFFLNMFFVFFVSHIFCN